MKNNAIRRIARGFLGCSPGLAHLLSVGALEIIKATFVKTAVRPSAKGK
jgi:hypothetical protein